MFKLTSNCGRPKAVSLTAIKPVLFVASEREAHDTTVKKELIILEKH